MNRIISLGGFVCVIVLCAYVLTLCSDVKRQPALAESNIEPVDVNRPERADFLSADDRGISSVDEKAFDDLDCFRVFALNGGEIYSGKDISTLTEYMQDCLDPLKSEPIDYQLFVEILQVWADIDLVGALNYSLTLPTPIGDYLRPGLVEHLAITSPRELELWMANTGSLYRSDLARAYYKGLAKTDPHEALAEILQHFSVNENVDGLQSGLVVTILEQWSQEDALSALNWLDSRKSEDALIRGLAPQIELALYIKLIEQDSQSAESKLFGLPDGPTKTRLLQHMTKYLAEKNVKQAVLWSRSIADANSRQIAVGSVLQYWAGTDVTGGELLDFVSSEPDELRRARLVEQAIETLGGRNHNELVALYDRLPDDKKVYAAQKIATNWIDTDLGAAVDWTKGLSHGGEKDAALISIATLGLYEFEHLHDALALAQEISDPDLKFDTVHVILESIVSENPIAAREILSEIGGFPDAQTQALNLIVSLSKK